MMGARVPRRVSRPATSRPRFRAGRPRPRGKMSGRGFRPARHGHDLQGALQSAVQDIVSSVIDHVEASTSLTAHSVRIDDSSEREQDLEQDLPSDDDFEEKSKKRKKVR